MAPGSNWQVSGQNLARPVMNSRSFDGLGSLRAGLEPSTANSFNALHPPAATTAVSPLMLIAPGPTRIVRSSAGMNWQGFILERHLTSPGERPATCIDMHIITMLCGNTAEFYCRDVDGNPCRFIGRGGSVTCAPIGPVPYVRLESPAEFTHVGFQQSFIRSVAEEMERKPLADPVFRVGVRDVSIQRILGLLTEEVEAEGPSGKLYVDSLAHALATRYLLTEDSPANVDVRTSPLPLRILNRVKEKIEASIHTDLSLESLAKESGYSRAHFLRMFRTATGVTPHQFVLDLRLRQAQNRIKETRDSLIDIAADCGFASQSHMTTVFRKYLDLTPAEIRRNSFANN